MRKVVLVAALLFLMGCSNYATKSDTQAVHEAGGPYTSAHLGEKCFGPSEKGREDWFGEKFYYYPVGPRSWLFDGTKDSDQDPFQIFMPSAIAAAETSETRIPIGVAGEATMTLTGNCELLKKFHIQYGTKYVAYSTEKGESFSPAPPGWDDFLQAKFAPQLKLGIQQTLAGEDYESFAKGEGWATFQDEAAKATLEGLNRSLGDDFFTNVQITFFQPALPESIQDAIVANEAARQFNTKAATEAKTRTNLVRQLGACGYLVYKAQSEGTTLPLCSIPSNVTLNQPIGQ